MGCGQSRDGLVPSSSRGVGCGQSILSGLLCLLCGRAEPIFNEEGQTKAVCCVKCKSATIVNIKDKKCRSGKAIPNFNDEGQLRAEFCAQCKTPSMVNVKGRKCQCGKRQPEYNEEGETTAICCYLCKTPSMVNVRRRKKCLCGRVQPSFGEPGAVKATCKTPTMVNVVSARCPNNKGFNCPFSFSGNRKYRNYRNYCHACFAHNFPLDPLTLAIRKFGDKEQSGILRGFNMISRSSHHTAIVQCAEESTTGNLSMVRCLQ